MSEAREEFAAFWRRERDRLYRALAVAVGDDGLAAEAVDEAMARAWQRWQRIGGYADPAAWVFRVARNFSTSWWRKWSRRPTEPAEALDRAVTDPASDPDVVRAVRGLPEPQRSVLVLRFWLDWPVERVAEALGIAPGTVQSRTHRALKALEGSEEVAR